MCRSNWELDVYVRHHIAELANERQLRSQIEQDENGAASLVTELRHRLGRGLIHVGHALAGDAPLNGLPTPYAHPAPWGHPGS